ncbi:MAG: glycoside hydrolase family 15 protein [Firmicutes bacterium]|nr:glycoside hydrolase family 15 protein [Bacillota bacterium]
MPRDLPLGNGSMLVTFDTRYHLRDLFYPYVGQENHTAGHYFRLGVAVDGRFSWVHGNEWERELAYEPRTLVTAVNLRHPGLGISIAASDAVDMVQNVLVRRFAVTNHHDSPRQVRLFLTQDFHIYGLDVGDTAFYDPVTNGVVHYKRERYFLVNGQAPGAEDAGVSSYSTGQKETDHAEGTWRDAEDGRLDHNPIAQGSVDSAIGLYAELGPEETATYSAWICAGHTLEEVRRLDGWVRYRGVDTIMARTRHYWYLWGDKEHGALPEPAEGTRSLAALEPELADLYVQSLLIIRTQVDNGGAIIAANDSDVMHYAHDTYSYVWPRDGAFVAMAMDRAGYADVAERFFAFCRDVVEPEGYFLHKYNPDRTFASSWHPWYRRGNVELPIQEDETGLVLIALWSYFRRHRNVETMKPWFRPLVVQAGEFMADYRNTETGLPLPSWDLWEERHGIHAFTVAAVYGGLLAATHFAKAFGEERIAERFAAAARGVQEGFRRYFLDPHGKRWYRSLLADEHGNWTPDPTWDASLLVLPRLGLVGPKDPVMVNTAQGVREHLWVPGPTGGLARYEHDPYQRVGSDPGVPGNPWFVCTLWYAEYLLSSLSVSQGLEEALDILRWTQRHGLKSGVLAEQLHPQSGDPVSVAPLTWSHAEYVWTVLTYLEREAWFGRCPTCGRVAGPLAVSLPQAGETP